MLYNPTELIFSALIQAFNSYWEISGKFLRPFYWKTHPSKNHEYPYIFLKNRVVTQTVLLENSSNRQLENSGASHRPFYWKTHPKESIQAKIIFYQFWDVTQAVLLENSSRPFFKVFFNFLNLFKLRQKKPLFLEEKQVNDKT